MDIVLEGFDTYLFDYAFAQLFPANPSLNALKSNASATFSSMREEPTARYNNYQFKRSSNYIQFPPGPNAWLTSWPRDDPIRQGISLYIITALFGILIYFIFAGLSYIFVFDKNTFKHPKYLKNQVSLEIKQTLLSIPLMAVFTAPLFWLEVRGYGKMYDTTDEGPGLWYNYFQFPLFLLFTDFGIYWIHRGLHHPVVYKHLHKPHHKWIMPTPFASHAFHPIDGFAQSIPYHVFPFIFPLQKFAYVGLFVFINVWTIMIHDGEYVANSPVINGAACHTLHHLYFNYNYGQYTTISDRIFGSYRKPNMELFRRETKMSEDEWRRQQKEMEDIVKEVEDKDDRVYLNEANGKKTQ